MQVMILEEDPTLRTRIAGALAPEGVDVLSFGRLAPAKEAARRAKVDILLLGDRVEGRLAGDVALLAEWRNPRLASLLLSDRSPEEAEDLFDLIPSLQAVLARGTGPRSLARLAVAVARAQQGLALFPEEEAEAADPRAEGDGHPPRPVPSGTPPAAGPDRVPGLSGSPPEEACATPPGPVPFVRKGAESPVASAGERPAAPREPTPSGLLYRLPSFLREEEPASAGGSGTEPPTTVPAVHSSRAAPVRRLHLA